MENQLSLDQLFSENFGEYEDCIIELRDYLKYNTLNQEESIICTQKIIPLIIFKLSNKDYFGEQIKPSISNELDILYILISDHLLEVFLIQNNIIQALHKLTQRFEGTFDAKIIKILAILKDSDQLSDQNIAELIKKLFGITKVMSMIGFQSNKASKIKMIYRICEIKRETNFKIIEPFVNSLVENLSKEGNLTEQFITSVEILSELIRFQKVKDMIIYGNNLANIIESISLWTKRYRTVLHNILQICIELITMNKATQLFVLHCGLLKHINSLIESNNYEVHQQVKQILNELCKDEQTINRLFLNRIITNLIDKYDQNYQQVSYFVVFQTLFLNGGESLPQYKLILSKFMEVFFRKVLLQSDVFILNQKFQFIYYLKQQEIYQKEVTQFFQLNFPRVKFILTQLIKYDEELVENLYNCYPSFKNL